MRNRLLPGLLLPLLVMAQGAKSPEAAVTVKVSTTFGEPVDGAQVSITSIGTKLQFMKTGEDVRFEGVPFDRYVIQAKAPGFVTQREVVGIYQEQFRYRMGLPLGTRDGGAPTEISGTVRTPGKLTDLWVRLLLVYAAGLLQCQTDRHGRYHSFPLTRGICPALIRWGTSCKLQRGEFRWWENFYRS